MTGINNSVEEEHNQATLEVAPLFGQHPQSESPTTLESCSMFDGG